MGIFFVIIPLMLIFIGVSAYYSHLQAKKRREEMAALADRLGWHFDPDRRSDWDNYYGQFSRFCEGHSRRAYNVLSGAVEIDGNSYPAHLGDYTYKKTSGSGKNRSTKTYYFSFLLLETPYAGIPEITVRPEGFFDGISAFMGFDDIDFESEEFSRKYHVKSSNKRFVYDVIDPQMMEFLLRDQLVAFELNRNVFLVASSRGTWKTFEFLSQLEWSQQFFERWPRHVVANLASLTPRI